MCGWSTRIFWRSFKNRILLIQRFVYCLSLVFLKVPSFIWVITVVLYAKQIGWNIPCKYRTNLAVPAAKFPTMYLRNIHNIHVYDMCLKLCQQCLNMSYVSKRVSDPRKKPLCAADSPPISETVLFMHSANMWILHITCMYSLYHNSLNIKPISSLNVEFKEK